MSGRIASEVFDNAPEDLTLGELTVLVVIALDAREKDRIARYCDLETIVKLSRLKPGTIRNALSELVDRGLLVPQRKTTYKGGYGHQEYLVTPLEMYHRNATRRPT